MEFKQVKLCIRLKKWKKIGSGETSTHVNRSWNKRETCAQKIKQANAGRVAVKRERKFMAKGNGSLASAAQVHGGQINFR